MTKRNEILEAAIAAVVTGNGTKKIQPTLLVGFETVEERDKMQDILMEYNPAINVKAGERRAEQSGTYVFQQTADQYHARKAKQPA